MSSNVKVKIDKSALNDVILEAAKTAVEGKSFEIACPHCGKTLSAPEGKSVCPHCGKEIDLVLNFNLD